MNLLLLKPIENSQWIYYKPVISLTDDVPIEFVVPGHGEDYLDLTPYYAKPLRTSGEFIESWNIIRRGQKQSRPRKSPITFDVQLDRRVLQSKTRITSKQRLRITHVRRGTVKLFFTGKNFQ
ncbi:hypothetical protein P5V15_002737 [Pogonomyrmex californicus]